jgi:hypothetical protein
MVGNFLKRFFIVVFSLILLAFVGYQAFSVFYNPIATQNVTLQTIEDIIPAKGYVINNEQIITGNVKGIIDYTLNDGDRVSKDGIVANVYPNSLQAENELKIRELDNKIKQLQINGATGDNVTVDISMLDAQISQKFLELSTGAKSSYVEGIDGTMADFLNLLNQKQIATGKASNFDKKLSELQSSRKSLAAQQSTNISSITSPAAGYFVSHIDGYEGMFDFKNALNITASQIDSLISTKAQAVSTNAIGKVISSYEWYLSCSLSPDLAKKISINSKVQIRLPFSNMAYIPATVMAMNKGNDINFAVVLKCDYMSNDLAEMRICNIEIIADSVTGVKIDTKYIDIINGVKGAYVLMGNTAKFKKLNVIYAGDGFVISTLDTSNQKSLQVYDEVILRSDNLYDGKIIR